MSEAIVEKDVWNTMSGIAQKKTMEFHKVIIRTDVFTKDGKPKCAVCGKEMKKSVDSKTGQTSPYLWELNCECAKNEKLKNFRISLG